MASWFFAFILLNIWLLFLLLRLRISFLHAALVFLSAQLTGVYILDLEQREWSATIAMTVGLFAFVFGMYWSYKKHQKRGVERIAFIRPPHPNLDLKILWTTYWIIAFFVVYHYVFGGIPIFSEDHLAMRFDHSRSGLLGLPGRINQFGTFFILFLVAAYRQLIIQDLSSSRWLFRLSIILLFVSLILWGNKGNLFQFAVAMAIVGCYERRLSLDQFQPRFFVKVRSGMPRLWIVALSLGSILGFAGIATLFLRIRPDLGSDVLSYFLERAFVISGRGFHAVVNDFAPQYGYGWGTYFLNDLQYFLNIFNPSSDKEVRATAFVSALIHERDVYGDKALAPVTINAFGYLYMEAGLWGVTIGGLCLGYFSIYLYYVVNRVKNALWRALLLFVQLSFFWILSKGNFGAFIPNITAMIVFFIVLVIGISVAFELIHKQHTAVTKFHAFR